MKSKFSNTITESYIYKHIYFNDSPPIDFNHVKYQSYYLHEIRLYCFYFYYTILKYDVCNI